MTEYMNNTNNERMNMLKKIQMYSFVLSEAGLFLDTHPDNEQALEYYRKYSPLLAEAVEGYEAKYGPLTPNTAAAKGTTWSWIEGNWPWQ